MASSPMHCDLEALGKLKVYFFTLLPAENTISIINLEGMLTGMKWLAMEAKYENEAKTIRNCKQK